MANEIIKEFEGLRLEAYQDSVGIWTIGYGNTYYLDGKAVRKGDKITKQEADYLFNHTVDLFASNVRKLVHVQLTSNQFEAIVSLAYNIGIGAFKSSTLLKKLNVNPNDPAIRNEFLKWKMAGGKEIKGLLNRRIKESDLYFKK